MASGEFSCNLCKDKGVEPFKAPNDPIGVALMQQHLKSDHNIEPVRIHGLDSEVIH